MNVYQAQDAVCVTLRRVRVNHCCSGQAMSIIYSETVFVALGILRAMSMRRIVICGLSGSTIFFSTLSHKRHDFRNKKKSYKEHSREEKRARREEVKENVMLHKKIKIKQRNEIT